ncbi:hypothetical protein CPC08DRAFT_783465 [Agrocybe pediades]|nr:hypothetical protein CPC08DRAFT_783465 [Agrocybe pediades]
MFPEARQLHVRARSILTSGRRYLPPTAIDGSSCQRGVSPSITRLYSVQQVTSVHERPTPLQTTGAPDGTNSSKGLTSYEQNLPPKREVHEEFNGKNDVAPNRPRHGRGGGRDPPPSDTHAAGRLIDALVTTSIGLGAVFLGGLVYVKWYKKNVLDKMEAAFLLGHDQTISLKKSRVNKTHINMRRKEQEIIDHIIQGNESTHYYMILGPKGAGKGEMILDAVAACNGEGVALCYAHPDLEVFRVRVGKALNFEFNEDTQLGLFQWREPREAGPSLDIERALNKLEEVAVRSSSTRGKPLVLVVNNVHLFQNDTDGRNMLLQLQEKAEEWAASGILTMIFSSDDFWPFHVMRKNANRMFVLSVNYQPQQEAMYASKRMKSTVAEEVDREEVVSIVGGRPYRFDKVQISFWCMKFIADYMVQIEKQWLLSQIGLVPDCDDDIIEDQKWSSRAWLLLREFVKLREEQLATSPASGTQNDLNDIPLPTIPYWKCREIMTRPDFMEELDRLNIIAIDTQYNVRPDSNLILLAAREVVREDGFEDRLHHVRNKIDELETLQRTRELLVGFSKPPLRSARTDCISLPCF